MISSSIKSIPFDLVGSSSTEFLQSCQNNYTFHASSGNHFISFPLCFSTKRRVALVSMLVEFAWSRNSHFAIHGPVFQDRYEELFVKELLFECGSSHPLKDFPVYYMDKKDSRARLASQVAGYFAMDFYLISVLKQRIIHISHNEYAVVMARNHNDIVDIVTALESIG